MSDLRLASLDPDGWQLRSGEDAHRAHPDTFWLPEERERRGLRRGMQAKLMFEMIEHVPSAAGAGFTSGTRNRQASASTERQQTCVERMWVAVTEVLPEGHYRGMLRNQPFTYDPNDESVYLRWGAEVAFGPEHVIDIDDTPAEEDTLTGFTRRWT